MADIECTCSVVKGERDIAWGEDCFCWYPTPNYNERIVRCRDCKHFKEYQTKRQLEYWCHSPQFESLDYEPVPVEPNGFCAWGEPKD